MLKLIPTDEKFFEMFLKQADFFRKGTAVLRDIADGRTSIKEGAARIATLESEADDVTHEVLVRLDRSFITPIDREDIHSLAHALDDCMDLVDAAIDHMDLYGITTPSDAVRAIADCLDAQSSQVHALIEKLPKLKWEAVRPYCIEINRLENDADKLTRKALAQLFQGGLEAKEVIKWRDVYRLFEKAADKCEDVAGIVEGIALKNG